MPEHFITVTALPAGPGDCLWIEYGQVNGDRYVFLVDTGMPGTLKHIQRRLDALSVGQVAALVVTHIDDDHIGSASKILSNPRHAEKIADVWFNGRRHCGSAEEVESFGITKALALEEKLEAGTCRWNAAFGGKSIVVGDGHAPVESRTLKGGLRVTVLGPTPEQLLELGRHWDDEVDALNERRRARELAQAKFTADLPPDMEAFGPAVFDVHALAQQHGSDSSPTNGSSISLLLEFAERRIVLAADSHAEPLLRVWSQFNLSNVDLFKVSHHGSRENTTLDLVQAMHPKRALICTDASRHGHPNDECIAMLVAFDGPVQVISNYTYDRLGRWDTDYMRTKYNFEILSGDGTIEIPL
ncbi:ComEC/Rec2 family competence protein [Burkholderia sp. AW50-3]